MDEQPAKCNGPTSSDLIDWLKVPLMDALAEHFGKIELSLLSECKTVADGTTVLLIKDQWRRSRAVVLCSSPVAPEMVERGAARAGHARSILEPNLGRH